MKRLRLLACFCLFLPFLSQAHTRGTSYSFWALHEQGAEVRVRVSQLELTRLQLDPVHTPDYANRVGEVLSQDLLLWDATGRCKAGPALLSAGKDGWLTVHWSSACDTGPPVMIRSQLLHDVAPSHLHFAKVTMPDGVSRERVLTYAAPELRLGPQAPAPVRALPHYLWLGVGHILSGWDHLAFVLALVLLAGSLREMAVIVTGFTIGHSLTLGLAVFGLVQTRVEVVEALIGFSIALVAAENLWQRAGHESWLPRLVPLALLGLALSGTSQLPMMVLLGLALFSTCHFALLVEATRPARLRAAIAIVFGLVHGFGFAGAIGELQLPTGQLAIALLGFNTGVEVGQLLVIGLLWPVLRLVDRWPVQRLWVNDFGAAVICALGTYWFVIRGF